MLLLGIVLMVLASLAFLEIGAFFNRAGAPSWTKRRWVGETTVILSVFLIGLGTACVISALVDAASQGLEPIEFGLAALALVGAVLLARWRRRGRPSDRALPAQARVMAAKAEDPVMCDQPPRRDQPPAGGSMRRSA